MTMRRSPFSFLPRWITASMDRVVSIVAAMKPEYRADQIAAVIAVRGNPPGA